MVDKKPKDIEEEIRKFRRKMDTYMAVIDEEKYNLPSHKAKELEKQKKLIDTAQKDKTSKKISNANVIESQRIMKQLRDENQEILKMNALYVLKNSNKYNIKDNKNINNIDEPKESKLPQNFKYVNDNVRSQLMRALLNYNPKIHLHNLKLLSNIDPDIKKDLFNLENMIEKDLEEVLDDHFYEKKWKAIRSMSKQLMIR